MKTFLTAMLFISIAFTAFILNKDFSEEPVSNNVDSDKTTTSLSQSNKTDFFSQSSSEDYPNHSDVQKVVSSQQSLIKNKDELKEQNDDSSSTEKLITWVNDKEELAELDQEMGLIEPTEYDQMILEDELNTVKHSTQDVEAIRSIALSERKSIRANYPELDGVMLEEELPSSSTMDQY